MSAQGPTPAVRLSVVIPAFNEEERLDGTLRRVFEYLSGRGNAFEARGHVRRVLSPPTPTLPSTGSGQAPPKGGAGKGYEPPMGDPVQFEVIVVDDGSTDGTVATARRAAEGRRNLRVVLNGRNRGKGFSVRRGVEESRGEFILFSDADLSTPIEDIEKLFPALLEGGYDIAIGSRSICGSDVRVRQPWYRELMGKIFNKVVRLFTLRGFYDTQCGFKLFTGDAARDVFSQQRVERFSFDVEALYLARKGGYRIAEVPVTWYNSPRSRVSVVGDPAQMFLDVLRIRLYDLRGRYRSGRRGGMAR